MKLSKRISIEIFIVISFLALSALGGYTPFDKVTVKPDEPIVRKFAMFKEGEAPARTWPGEGRSYIKLEFTATGENNIVHFITAHSSSANTIGLVDTKTKKIYYCCTSSLSMNNAFPPQCNVGDVLGHHSDNLFYAHKIITNSENKTLKWELSVPETGLWYNYIISCPLKENTKLVSLDGHIDFMNPFGNLNGEWWYNMPFFLSLMLVYILVFIWWIGVSFYHRRQLLQLQNWIGLVVLCGVIETAALYFAYLGFNNIGQNYIGAMIVGTLVSSLKKTLSRVLILVVCMGYGVVKPTLGTTSYKVGLLGFFYFLFSSASYVTALVHKSGNIAVSDSWTLLLVLPTSFLDTWFYWWTLTSLIRTITLLQERKQPIKLAMYKKFFVTLIGLGCSLIIVVLSETIVMFATSEDQTWKVNWIWDAFFEILYFVMLVTVAIIWRPINNNTRYAYNEVDSQDDQIEQVMLSNLNNVQQRKGFKDKDDEGDESKASFTINDEDHA